MQAKQFSSQRTYDSMKAWMTKQLRDVPKIIQEADAEKPSTLAPELPSQGLT